MGIKNKYIQYAQPKNTGARPQNTPGMAPNACEYGNDIKRHFYCSKINSKFCTLVDKIVVRSVE